MFPITEVLDLLAMIRGQKPFNWPDAIDNVASLAKFAAAQIRAGNVPQQINITMPSGFEAQLQQLADAHNANALSLPFDWKALLREGVVWLLSKFLT